MIEAPTLSGAAAKLKAHLNALLAQTITQVPLVVFSARDASRANVAFRQAGKPNPAVLTSRRFGRFLLHLLQVCEGVPNERGVELQTVRYRYSLTADGAHEPLLRWDYEKRPGAGRWCRHHLQGDIALPKPFQLSLNKLHVPTGYTLIEDVIRFCINDLDVAPLSLGWHTLLEQSEQTFKRDFAPPADRR